MDVQIVVEQLKILREFLNERLLPFEPIVIAGGTAFLAYALHCIVLRIPKDGLFAGARRTFFRFRNKIPLVKSLIDKEIGNAGNSIASNVETLYCSNSKLSFINTLPSAAYDPEVILNKVVDYLKLGYDGTEGGLMSGALYHGGEALTKLNTKVYELSSWSNTLHAEVFPGILRMEAEIVRMVADLFNGDHESCGSVTSCGTESIILAVKAYRDFAVAERGILYPEILVPITAHSSFEKAANLLNIGIKFVPINKTTCSVDLAVMRKMISKNTIMLVGSAPAYPHGCMDDIKQISELGVEKNVPVHVDACLGGFLIVFMEDAGFPLSQPFDFRLGGVTSISADTHKYGYAPKGSSVLLFRNASLRKYQYSIHTQWPGGLYASQTLAGSRPGALIAVCWTSLLYFGREGYVEITKKIISTARHIKYKLRQINGLSVMGNPEVSIIALESKAFDIYRLLELLKANGWVMNALQFPPSIHFCLSYNQTEDGIADKFVSDVEAAVETLMADADSAPTGVAAIYGTSQTISDRSLITEITSIYLDTLYRTDFESKTKTSNIL